MRHPKHKRYIKHLRNLVEISPVELLCFSGASVLISMALGASPDKALEYGIECLRKTRIKFKIIDEDENKEPAFMLGLA